MHEELGGAQPGQLIPVDHSDNLTPWGVMLSTWSWGGRRRKGWTFRVRASAFPSYCYIRYSPAVLGMVEHLSAQGK